MKKQAKYIFLLGVLFCIKNIQAQFLSEDYRSKECIITQLNTENGLPSNAITGLAWQEDGNLIFTTEGGIVRFNGQQILTDSLSIPFYRLIKTAENRLVAMSRGGQIYEIKNGEICQYYFPGETNNTRFTLARLATVSLDFNYFKESVTQKEHPFYWFDNPKLYRKDNKILYDEILQLHICSEDGKYNLATIEKDHFFSNLIFIDKEPYLINRKCQLKSIQMKAGKTQEVKIKNYPFSKPEYPIQYFYEYGQRNPVIIADNRAWALIKNTNQEIEMKLISDCLPAGILIKYADYIPEHQMLVLGTESHGLFILKKDYFTQALPSKLLNGLGTAFYLQIPINDQTIVTNRGYIVGPDEKNIRPGMKIHEDIGNSWLKDSKGNYWYSQKDSIIKYDPVLKKKKIIAVIEVPAPEMKKFIEFKDSVYIATPNGIYISYEDQIIGNVKFAPKYALISFPGDIEVFANNIYVSTCGGLIKYDPAKRKLENIFQIKNTCFRDIFILNNSLFIGTYGEGIFRIQGNKIQRLPRDKHNYLAFAHCFMQDENKNIWISSNRGIFRTTTEFLLKDKYNQLDKYHYIYYGREDGVKPSELNGGCKPCGIKIGELFSFPSMDGLIQFNPLIVPNDTSNYPVQIEGIEINDNPIEWQPGNQIKLSLEEGMKIDFSCPWWSNGQNLHLAYQIEGLDDHLIRINYPHETNLKITRLPAGNYSINILRLNQSGQRVSDNLVSILIHVESAWYRKPGGIIMISLIAGIFFWVVFQLRINRINEQKKKLSRLAWEKEHTVRTQKDHLIKTVDRLRKSQVVLEENNRMKNHVISILSHDLVTPLKYLSIAGRGILKNPEKYDKNTLLQMIMNMNNTAQQLEILSTNILSWIKYFRTNRNMVVKTFDLFELVDRTHESLSMFISRKGNKFNNNIPEGTFVTQIHEPLSVIIFNLIVNANKYTKDGEISVDYESQGDFFLIHVSDSGEGIPPEKVQKILKGDPLESSPDTEMQKGNGLGYLIIRELINLIKGEIQIETELGHGTTVTIKLPLMQLLP